MSSGGCNERVWWMKRIWILSVPSFIVWLQIRPRSSREHAGKKPKTEYNFKNREKRSRMQKQRKGEDWRVQSQEHRREWGGREERRPTKGKQGETMNKSTLLDPTTNRDKYIKRIWYRYKQRVYDIYIDKEYISIQYFTTIISFYIGSHDSVVLWGWCIDLFVQYLHRGTFHF